MRPLKWFVVLWVCAAVPTAAVVLTIQYFTGRDVACWVGLLIGYIFGAVVAAVAGPPRFSR